MSEFKPTHRSKADVEVHAYRSPDGHWLVEVPCTNPGGGACFRPKEFDLLFNPIPKPKMVKIPLLLARHLSVPRPWGPGDQAADDALRAAIAEAEREEAAND